MSSRGYPKRSARAAGIKTYSTSRRQRRSNAGNERGVVVSTENLGVPAVAWTKVLRYPSAPLDEPYFGRRPKASFKVPIWVRVDELTEEEKARYDEVEKKREEQRAVWKKEMEIKRDEADKESAHTEKENQTKVESNGEQEAPTEGKSETSAMVVEPQNMQDSVMGGQNKIETTEQTITDGSTDETKPPVASAIASNEQSTNDSQQIEGGDVKQS